MALVRRIPRKCCGRWRVSWLCPEATALLAYLKLPVPDAWPTIIDRHREATGLAPSECFKTILSALCQDTITRSRLTLSGACVARPSLPVGDHFVGQGRFATAEITCEWVIGQAIGLPAEWLTHLVSFLTTARQSSHPHSSPWACTGLRGRSGRILAVIVPSSQPTGSSKTDARQALSPAFSAGST